MASITYEQSGQTVTLPIGRDHDIRREDNCADICLSRDVAEDFPLTVTILIRTSGDVVLWSTAWSSSPTNTHWHFAAGSDRWAKDHRPTDAQLATLEWIFLSLAELPGGLKGALGAPVVEWAFAGQSADGIAAKHGEKTPLLA